MFRLHLAEEPESVTPPHVALAIFDCDQINNTSGKWAKLEVIPNPNGPIVRLEIGNILSGGFHECKIQTWTYSLDNGRISIHRHTHN